MNKKNIFILAGVKGSGKTVASMQAEKLEKTFMVQVDKDDTDPSLFGGHLSLTRYNYDQMAPAFIEAMEKVKSGKFSCLVIDTYPRLSRSLWGYFKRNVDDYRHPSTYAGKGGGEINEKTRNKEAKAIESSFIGLLKEKFGFVILTSHVYIDQKINRLSIEAREEIQNAAICSLWLERSQDKNAPQAIVVKNMVKIAKSKDGYAIPTKVFPPLITPNQSDISIWEPIERYWDNPVGNRPLEESEKLRDDQYEMIAPNLTEAQKKIKRMEAKEKEKQQKRQDLIEKERIIREIKNNNHLDSWQEVYNSVIINIDEELLKKHGFDNPSQILSHME